MATKPDFYDVNLGRFLPANNGRGVVFNDQFVSWHDQIEINLHDRFHGSDRYERDEEKELLTKCKKHAKKYETPLTANNVVVITHPLYLQLTHMHKVNSIDILAEIAQYTENLVSLLKQCSQSKNVDVLFLETVHHYAAATSLFLEAELVNQVIFTLYDGGEALDPSDLNILDKKFLYVCGGYNGQCLRASIDQIMKKFGGQKIKAMKDLIINAPYKYDYSIKPLEIYKECGVEFEISKIISLEDLIEQLGL